MPRTLLLAALLTALLAPAASAHTAIYSADNKVRGSVGLLNEPVSSYAVTGLDVCFTQNTTASPRPAVNVGNAGNFTVSLRAPNGAVHRADVSIPFGKANCLTFDTPLVLTQPGQYLVDLSGSINGTTFAVTGVKAGGEVRDRADITFPDESVSNDQELQAKLAALEAKVSDLQARLDAHDAAEAEEDADKGSEFAPPAPGALLMVGLVALVAVLRRR